LSAVLLRALVLLALTLFVCWPQWSQAELDGTEARRVQIAQEMARSGDWLVPTLGGQPTYAKPPLHYWLLAASEGVLGANRFAWRLPSVLAAFAAAFLAGELLRRWFGGRAGWIGALGVATSPLVLFAWPTAEIDPLFATLVGSSLWCLAVGVARDRPWLVGASGVLAGLSLLQKGPPFFVFAIGAYLVWWRHRRGRFAVWHLLPLLAVVATYYVPLWLLRVGPSAMFTVAGDESVGRLWAYEWRHVLELPGFWLRAAAVQVPFVFWCLWEWRGARDARMAADDLVLRMCSGGAVVAIAVLSLFPGRPTRYLLPNVLLFTFAVAPAVAHFAAWRGPVPPLALRVCRCIGIAGAVALLVLPFVPAVGAAALGLAAVASVGAFAARTPARVVALSLVLPVVGAWTIGLDRARSFGDGSRSREHAARLLRVEALALGFDPAEARTIGHFDSALLMAGGWLLPGNESAKAPWSGRWVLHELDDELPVPPNYALRLVIALPFESFALSERIGG